MRRLRSAVVYLALCLTANAALAADLADLEALREGTMRKLIFHGEPMPVSEQSFIDADGTEVRLADYEGKIVVLNFWATWCAPCRKEMPMLSTLQRELGGDDFAVVTLATTRNSPQAIDRFFAEIGVDNLPKFQDPDSRVARDMAVLGLPITVILDRDGMEIARMRGDADWDSPSAFAILEALIGAGEG